MHTAARLATLLALLAGVLMGCGGESASDGEPTGAVPKDAVFYLEATVGPEGELRTDALAAAGKLLRTDDPAGRIEQLVMQGFAESSERRVDYARDIEPWIGEKVGVWGAPAREDGALGAVLLLAAEDTGAAEESLERLLDAGSDPVEERSHEGTDYLATPDGDTAAIVDYFVVLGSEAELKRTIDATEGGTLADDARYKDAIGDMEAQRLGHFYIDARALYEAAKRRGGPNAAQLQQFEQLFDVRRLGPLSGAFMADGEKLVVDTVTRGDFAELVQRFGLPEGAVSTPLVGELPGDAWGALGVPRLGESLEGIYQQLEGALGGAVIAEQIRRRTGLDLKRDVLAWIGDVAVFVRGTSMDAVEGGLVIEVTDETAAEQAFGKVAGLLQAQAGANTQRTRIAGAETAFVVSPPGLPKPVVLARSGDRVVVAYGEEAARQAFRPDSRLGESELFQAGKAALGGEFDPAFLLSVPQALALADATGATTDPEFQQVRPYLDALGVIVASGEVQDDLVRSRLAVGLKEAGR